MGAIHTPRHESAAPARRTAIYGIAVLTGAALVFQIQPIAGKWLLPVFGGGAAVWTTCMFFFQSMLLAGYGYAYWLTSSLTARRQALLHAVLLALSLLLLRMGFAFDAGLASDTHPNTQIWVTLFSTIGFPFLMLASTAPLIQRWSSITRPGKSPYRLYALSNLGALLALLTYPLLVEPNLTLDRQGVIWSAGYVIFVMFSFLACRHLWRSGGSPVTAAGTVEASAPPWSGSSAVLTMVLSAGGVVMLLAMTNHMTRNVAPIPFLWIAPLVVYMLTFIACFSGERWYDRPVWGSLFVVSACLLVILEFLGASASVPVLMPASLLILLCTCMICHGELYRQRPHPQSLAAYYLLIAGGGALGGAFVSVAAPAMFDRYWESLLGAYLVYLAFGVSVLRDTRRDAPRPISARQARLDYWVVRLFALGWALGIALYPAVVYLVESSLPQYDIDRSRNFYGVLKVRDVLDDGPPQRRLVDGTTIHGVQFLDPGRSTEPLSYYGAGSGIGYVMRHMDRPAGGLRIGAVGLGTGTIAAYSLPGDDMRFYELNPAVAALARQHFSFLRDSQAAIEIVIGDGRISLERELEESGSRNYDLLVIDAFTSDAVPVHLLTVEAQRVYWSHLNPEGLLAVHVTNSFLDLVPVVADVAVALGKHAVHLQSTTAGDGTFASDWVVVTAGVPFADKSTDPLEVIPLPASAERPWSDDYSDLLRTLRH